MDTEELRIAANWEDFLDILPKCEYRIEYAEGEIISFMGYASEEHEIIVANIIKLLGNLLSDDFSIRGSNLALHLPGAEKRYFNADCTVVKGPSEKVELKGNMKAITNPILLVEILSPSTYSHDLGLKTQSYRQIPSLQQVLLIDSTKMNVVSQSRLDKDSEWLLQEYSSPDDSCAVLGQGNLSLSDIYRKVNWTNA